MKQPQNKDSKPAQQVQIEQLKAKKEKTTDPALKAAIENKIELLKSGKDVKK